MMHKNAPRTDSIHIKLVSITLGAYAVFMTPSL